jgi:hypothetical protein
VGGLGGGGGDGGISSGGLRTCDTPTHAELGAASRRACSCGCAVMRHPSTRLRAMPSPLPTPFRSQRRVASPVAVFVRGPARACYLHRLHLIYRCWRSHGRETGVGSKAPNTRAWCAVGGGTAWRDSHDALVRRLPVSNKTPDEGIWLRPTHAPSPLTHHEEGRGIELAGRKTLARGDRKCSLNDRQTPNFRVERAHAHV